MDKGDNYLLGAIVGTYLALTIAVNGIALPIMAGWNELERLVGGQKKQTTATLIDKGATRLHTGGNARWGEFATLKGDTLKLYEAPDIPSGKFFSWTELNKAEVGGVYKVTSLEGPISSKLIDLECSNSNQTPANQNL